MTNIYATTFNGQPFRFVAIKGHPGETFIPYDDLINAFSTAIPGIPKELHHTVIIDGTREHFGAEDKQRAVIDGVIVPVINLMAVITIVQGLNGAIRENRTSRKAANGFRAFETFFAENIGKAERALGTVPVWARMGLSPAVWY